MPRTRRELLSRAAFGLGAGAFHSALPLIARAQTTSAGVVERTSSRMRLEDALERVDARLVGPVLQAHQRAIELILSESMNA